MLYLPESVRRAGRTSTDLILMPKTQQRQPHAKDLYAWELYLNFVLLTQYSRSLMSVTTLVAPSAETWPSNGGHIIYEAYVHKKSTYRIIEAPLFIHIYIAWTYTQDLHICHYYIWIYVYRGGITASGW